MFIAREKELSTIKNFLNSRGALLVYGLRRVGKTTLIKKAVEDSSRSCVYFECQLTDEATNVSLFVDLLKEQLGFVDAKFDSFLAVFKVLNKQYPNYIFVIDEYSLIKQYYFKSKKANMNALADKLDSEFQNIVDEYCSEINLIISGSSIHIMKQLTDYKNPLYGRFIDKIALQQFNYLDAKKMLNKISNKEVISFYSVFGGSPYVLEKVDTSKSLKENICELILNEDGKLRTHLLNNVINELDNDADLHNILDVIKNGSKKYKEIESQAHIETSGLLDKRLNKLLELDIIEVRFPIGREFDRKKKYYQIKDNLLKFYYSYIYRQDNRIKLLTPSRYYDLYIDPSINGFISKRFEIVVREYFSIAISKGQYMEVIDIGTYFTNDSEFDCVLKKDNGKYTVYEVKFFTKAMTMKKQKEGYEQVKQIKGLDIDNVGFVCSSGFTNKIDEFKYLDLRDIFFE